MTGVYVALPLTADQRRAIEAVAQPVHCGPDGGARPPILDGCEIAFGNIPPEWLHETRSLRWLQLESVGFGEYLPVLGGEPGRRIRVTNLAGFFDEPVAESILAGILAQLRGIDAAARLKDRRVWEGDALRPKMSLLLGARVVVFGHGAIGRRVAALLAPFRCAISAFGSGWDASALDDALASADVVVAVAPHTPRTDGVFDRRRIDRLKEGALFVNFGRGSLVDEAALADALTSGRLGGAVLDVTVDEPLPHDHPFWQTPRLVLTQHSGGGTADEVDRKVERFVQNLVRYRNGDPLLGVVDPDKGY